MGRRLLVLVLVLLTAGVGASYAAPAQGWWLARIGADPALAPGPGVPIEIVDSGLDATHPEFAGRPSTTYANPQTTASGGEWHGTAVAGVADGVYPQAALESWDINTTGTLSTDEATAAIAATAQHCPRVINLSFEAASRDDGLADAILAAQHAGCLVVSSAGNGGASSSVVYPAALPHVLSVGSTDENDAVAPFSAISPYIDLVAPGVDIVTSVPRWQNSAGYDTVKGTSFSAPLVSAAAAWVWTARPTLSAFQLSQLLRSTAHDLGDPGYDNTSGYGLLDIRAALAAPTPAVDPSEPNDDVDQIRPGALFADGRPPLTTSTKQSNRIAGTLDTSDDPRDLYRIWIPAKKVVRVAVTGSAGAAAARIWGPRTAGVNEGLQSRRRDLRGPKLVGGKKGTGAYVEVLLTGRSNTAHYTLGVTASKK